MTNLKVGSTGTDVEKLQNALTAAGYDVGSTGADGKYGKNTEAAVRKYQQDNGLAVDGIAGQNTLGKLYGSTQSASTGNTGSTQQESGVQTASPAGSDAVQEAKALLQQHTETTPAAWEDPYQDKWMGYAEQYENREPFSYDVNADALYQLYKDQYVQQGQMAMMDTMGQAAALTGGYGNSYAQSVGQQAYNQYIGQLNDVVPELYAAAYDRYAREGDELLSKYELYKGMSEDSYTKHQDETDAWYREYERLAGDYDSAYSRDYTEKQNAQDLVLSGAANGYRPADEELEKAGVSREMADAYYNAYTQSLAGGTATGTAEDDTPQYTALEMGSDAYKMIQTQIDEATTLDDLARLAYVYENMGYDPELIYALLAKRRYMLTPSSSKPPLQ